MHCSGDGVVAPTVGGPHHRHVDNTSLEQFLYFTAVVCCVAFKSNCVGGCHAYNEGRAASLDSRGMKISADLDVDSVSPRRSVG